MNRKLAAPVVNAVVLRVADDALQTLLWRRSDMDDRWSLPGGFVREGETLAGAMRRHLVAKVGVSDVGHVEQLDTSSSYDTHPDLWLLDVTHLALIPRGSEPQPPPDTEWHPVDDLPPIAFGHAAAVGRAHERLRGKLSYSNVAFSLAPPRFTLRELAEIYEAVLGYAVDATHLRRVLERDGLIAPTGGRRSTGGRPAEEFAFSDAALVVSRPLAAFRAPRAARGRAPGQSG